jgi:hypothetical protein
MRSIIQHLRFPFSIFLLPVYLFALSQAPSVSIRVSWWSFFIIHFLVYPASNGYNSYFDKDEGPIGGVEKPLPVAKPLFYTAWALDILAIMLAMVFCSWQFALELLIYGLISKAYSHPAIRLKKYPLISWLTVGLIQGGFMYWSVLRLLSNYQVTVNETSYWAGIVLASLPLLAFYPITQIYQHAEDSQRGDRTLSLALGKIGTMLLCSLLFGALSVGYFLYFGKSELRLSAPFMKYLVCMGPSVGFFAWWFLQILKNPEKANFKNTMAMNALGSLGMNAFFVSLLF